MRPKEKCRVVWSYGQENIGWAPIVPGTLRLDGKPLADEHFDLATGKLRMRPKELYSSSVIEYEFYSDGGK